MSADGLSFRYEPELHESGNSIVALLPVWAYECEVHPPYERELDAYEDAVLRMVRLEMGPNAIANALNASLSLIGTIISNLQDKAFVEKKSAQGWRITNDAQAYFDGYYKEKASENAEYGYMFVSALRKDVLPYYHRGSLDAVRLLRGGFSISRQGNDEETYQPFIPDNRSLGKAYSIFQKAMKAYNLQAEQEISISEASQIAEDLFADLDSMDEYEPEDFALSKDTAEAAIAALEMQEIQKERLIVRRLNKNAQKCYLRLRITFDPSVSNGFRVDSPFDLRGIDNSCYLRQIQWMMNSDDILLGKDPLRVFLERESVKLGSSRRVQDLVYEPFLREKLPLLIIHKDSFPKIYEDFRHIYSDIQNQSTLMDQENIVNQICTKMLEALYRRIFQSVPEATLKAVNTQALREIRQYGAAQYKSKLLAICNLPSDTLQRTSPQVVEKAIKNLPFTKGNSVLEKMFNLMSLYYLAPNPMIRRYVDLDDFQVYVDQIADLNRIRNSVAHNADHPFTTQSYTDFMNKVFPVAHRMIKTIVGGN